MMEHIKHQSIRKKVYRSSALKISVIFIVLVSLYLGRHIQHIK